MPQEAFGCVGSSIITASGKYIDLANPDPAAIHILDIAKSLSNLCRFGGHTRRFYSVAEHTWFCVRVAISKRYPLECQQAISLHDGSEAYLQDIVKPLKVLLPQYQELEQRMMAAIQRKFGVDFARWQKEIEAIDHSMLIAERNFLFGTSINGWEGEDQVEKLNLPLACLDPVNAERALIRTFCDLHLCEPPAWPSPMFNVDLPVQHTSRDAG